MNSVIDWSNLSSVDWVIVVVLGVSILLSLWRGFAREAISLAGWVLAYIVANLYVGQMAQFLAQWIDNPTGRYAVGFACLFVATLMFSGIVQRVMASVLRITGLALLDRLLGTVFGFARGVIVILVGVYLLRQVARSEDLAWLSDSQLMPHLDYLADWARDQFYKFGA